MMSCEAYRESIVAQLCGDIEPEAEAELNAHLESCESCRQLRTEFSGIVGMVRQLPDRDWDETLRIRNLLKREHRWRTILLSKAAIWLVALTLAVTAVSYLPIRWEVSAHGLTIQWGEEKASQEMEMARELKALRTQLSLIQKQNEEWRQSSETRIRQLIEQNNAEQQNRYWNTLQLFANYNDLQRTADLQKIQHDIASTYDRTGQEVQRTNELLEYVMRASLTDSSVSRNE